MLRAGGSGIVCLLLVLLHSHAYSQPDLQRVASDAVTQWQAEKNKLLGKYGLGVQVTVDTTVRELIVRKYREQATKFLGRNDAYREIGVHLAGSPGVSFLESQGFYKAPGPSFEAYALQYWVEPQVRRNMSAILDQYLFLYLIRNPGAKAVILAKGFIEDFPALWDDCDLPPRTRLWCKH